MTDLRYVLGLAVGAALAVALVVAVAVGALWLNGLYAQASWPLQPRTELTVRLATDPDARDRTIEVLGRRLDSLGLKHTFTRSGADLIVIQVLLQPDTARLKEVVVTPGKLEFRLVDTLMSPLAALSESELLYQQAGDQRVPILVKKQAMVDGTDLTDAQAAYELRSGEPVVNFKFNSAGARKFGRATQENVGRPFAIVLDNEVLSAPVIREPILGGAGQIAGNFTVQSAYNLALLLRSGALPAPLTIIEERTVEP